MYVLSPSCAPSTKGMRLENRIGQYICLSSIRSTVQPLSKHIILAIVYPLVGYYVWNKFLGRCRMKKKDFYRGVLMDVDLSVEMEQRWAIPWDCQNYSPL